MKTMQESKQALMMLGVDEACYDKQGNLLGYVGFHDYDGYIEKPELEVRVRRLAIRVGTHVYCLKTGYGYHFVSFQILSPEQFQKWKLTCREIFPSDYKDNLCEKCLVEMDVGKEANGKEQFICPKCSATKLLVKRVLRISPKPSAQGQAMRPTFLLAWHHYYANPVKLSQGHLKVYSDTTVFGTPIIPDLYESIVETTETLGIEVEMIDTDVALCNYLTTAHLED